jgi:hypothetical protein
MDTAAAHAERPAVRQCVSCKQWRDMDHFITLTKTGRDVKSCRVCRLNSQRKNVKKKVKKSQVEKRVERLKRRIEVMYSQEALTAEVREVIDQALLGFFQSDKTMYR